MPKKTKKQKLLAEQRRHFIVSPTRALPSVQPNGATHPFAFHLQESKTPTKLVQTIDDKEELAVIQKDLTKTIVLAMVAIATELGVHKLLRGT